MYPVSIINTLVCQIYERQKKMGKKSRNKERLNGKLTLRRKRGNF